MTIAERNEPAAAGIKSIMEQKGLRQRWVAERSGLTEQQLSDRLTGRSLISVSELQPLANALGAGLGEIFAKGYLLKPYVSPLEKSKGGDFSYNEKG